jgi:hypothetical protein
MTPFLKRRHSSLNCGGVKFLSTFFAKANCKGQVRTGLKVEKLELLARAVLLMELLLSVTLVLGLSIRLRHAWRCCLVARRRGVRMYLSSPEDDDDWMWSSAVVVE